MYHLQRKRMNWYSQNLIVTSHRVHHCTRHFPVWYKTWITLPLFFFFQTSWKKKKKVGPYCSASRAGCENNSPLKEPKSRQNTPGHESLEDQWMVKDWVCESRVLSGAEFTGRSDAVCQRCYWTLIIWATVSSAATCDVSVCSMGRQKTILISFVWGKKLNAMKMQQQFFFVFFFLWKYFSKHRCVPDPA